MPRITRVEESGLACDTDVLDELTKVSPFLARAFPVASIIEIDTSGLLQSRLRRSGTSTLILRVSVVFTGMIHAFPSPSVIDIPAKVAEGELVPMRDPRNASAEGDHTNVSVAVPPF